MKCAICHREISGLGFCVSYVAEVRIWTASVHQACFRQMVGEASARNLVRLCIDSGWEQLELPQPEGNTLEQVHRLKAHRNRI